MPARKRHDPPFRSDLGQFRTELLDTDENRVYVFLNPNDSNQIASYEAMGYEVERIREGGPRLASRKPPKEEGGPVTFHGQVLYSCDRAEREAVEAEGQSIIDGYDRRIKGGTIDDGIRGLGARVEHHQSVER
jgi:hypothetical protein